MRIYSLGRQLLILLSMLVISGCASHPSKSASLFKYKSGFSVDIAEKAKQGINEMAIGNFQAARQEFQQALRYDPTNCQLNFLNALTYHVQGGKGNTSQLNLAEVGYKVATRFCPSDPWPHYYQGLISTRKGHYDEAEKQFSLAVRYDTNKESQKFLNAYLVSSYNNGDYLAASNLIRKLNKIDPNNKYSKLIKNRLTEISTRKPDLSKDELENIYDRLRKKQGHAPHAKKELIVDAVIILSEEIQNSNKGVNLLNGLQMAYSLSSSFANVNANNVFNFMQETKNKFGSVTTPTMNTLPFSRVVTNAITIPAVTYSLNIFNQADEKDEILARPSLLVEDGTKATYFSGDQLLLGIQGTQSGSVTEKDIGVDLEVTPAFQEDGSIELHVLISRAFLRPITTATTFTQVAEAVKDKTETTVNLRYGETAILSALTESLNIDSQDQAPGLSSLPLVKYLFSNRQKKQVNNNVLILLTPRPYISFDSDIYNKQIEEQLNKLYHKVINPGTNLHRTLMEIQTIRALYQPISISLPLYDSEFLKKVADQEYKMLTDEVQ